LLKVFILQRSFPPRLCCTGTRVIRGHTSSRATPTLVPELPRRQNAALYKTSRSDEQGRVLLTNLAPGQYKLFAWDNVPLGAWMNAEFMEKVEARRTSVVVNGGLRQSAQVRAIIH
jgi:hypothetical protein